MNGPAAPSLATFVYKADPVRGQQWAEVFREHAPDIEFRIWPDIGAAANVRFLAAWEPPDRIGERFPQLEVLFSSGAGVDQFDLQALPAHLPVVRMVEPGIVQGMVEYVTRAVLDLHRDMPQYRRQQQQGVWRPLPVRPANQRRVGVLGLGSLGQAVLRQLQGLGFACAGWSRSRHTLAGVDCFAGPGGLSQCLAHLDILVCLLPLTDATRGLLNADLFRQLPRGASLVHTGRGPQLATDDLLAALDSGQLAEAVLDVTDPEPLRRPCAVAPSKSPGDAPYRQHDPGPQRGARHHRQRAPIPGRPTHDRAGGPKPRLLRRPVRNGPPAACPAHHSRTMCRPTPNNRSLPHTNAPKQHNLVKSDV